MLIILMRAFRFIFGLYAGMVFIISLLIFVPQYFFVFLFFSDKKAPVKAHRVSQLWARFLFLFFFIKTEIHGEELIDNDVVYVFVANHRSMLDIPLYARSCKNTFRFLSKAELAKIPLLGYVIRKLYITVDRKDKANRSKSIEVMRKSIDSGISVFLCPEGTRNKTLNPLLEFKDGAFRLAIATQSPIAVLTVVNTDKLLSPQKPIELLPGKLIAAWSPVIKTKGLSEDDIPFIKEKVKEEMLSHLSRLKK